MHVQLLNCVHTIQALFCSYKINLKHYTEHHSHMAQLIKKHELCQPKKLPFTQNELHYEENYLHYIKSSLCIKIQSLSDI